MYTEYALPHKVNMHTNTLLHKVNMYIVMNMYKNAHYRIIGSVLTLPPVNVQVLYIYVYVNVYIHV